MKLSISNIAWEASQDETVYDLMQRYGYSGLEIAPTRIFPKEPYERLKEAKEWSLNLKKKYGFKISSMQSIWFGRQEKLFGSEEERQILIDYTKKAINFAKETGCKNLVFGCPKNRSLPEGMNGDSSLSFFKELGDYAAKHGTVLAMEANPPIYNTNYINTTAEALTLVKQVDSPGFLLNLDVGAMICNEESAQLLEGQVRWINHAHISEPGLESIQKRRLHGELWSVLQEGGFKGYISIEMKKQENLKKLEMILAYMEKYKCKGI